MKFRRKAEAAQASAEDAVDQSAAPGQGVEAAGEGTATSAGGSGPFDVSQVEGDGVERADLGSLLVPAIAERELRLQVDEKTGQVRAVMLAGSDGACEFQAFAAPRNGDLWSDVRPQIAEDMVRRGGHATEREGRWGTELVCQMPVKSGLFATRGKAAGLPDSACAAPGFERPGTSNSVTAVSATVATATATRHHKRFSRPSVVMTSLAQRQSQRVALRLGVLR